MELRKKDMIQVSGGALASSMLNAITKAVNTVYNLGRQAGSSLRRIVTRSYCAVR